jgi:hypothetical protein
LPLEQLAEDLDQEQHELREPALRNMPSPGSTAHEEHEQALTGEAADRAQAAAVKAAGGGTAGDVTTDYSGDGYEVTVTKSDGSKVEIHLDHSFDVLALLAAAAAGHRHSVRSTDSHLRRARHSPGLRSVSPR